MLKSMRDSLSGILQFLYWVCIIGCIITGGIIGKIVSGFALVIGLIIGGIIGFLFATCSVGVAATIICISETLDEISDDLKYLKSINRPSSSSENKNTVPVTTSVFSGESKICKKCGAYNPKAATNCKDCGEYL